MGVTVTNSSDKHRIHTLTQNIKCPNYFLTFEPLFGAVGELKLDKIGWIVIGTETGNHKGKITAQANWIKNIVLQAQKKNIPVFMKARLLEIVGE